MKQKTNSKIMDLNLITSIITQKANETLPVKSQRKNGKMSNAQIFTTYKNSQFKFKNGLYLKGQKIYHVNTS